MGLRRGEERTEQERKEEEREVERERVCINILRRREEEVTHGKS